MFCFQTGSWLQIKHHGDTLPSNSHCCLAPLNWQLKLITMATFPTSHSTLSMLKQRLLAFVLSYFPASYSGTLRGGHHHHVLVSSHYARWTPSFVHKSGISPRLHSFGGNREDKCGGKPSYTPSSSLRCFLSSLQPTDFKRWVQRIFQNKKKNDLQVTGLIEATLCCSWHHKTDDIARPVSTVLSSSSKHVLLIAACSEQPIC